MSLAAGSRIGPYEVVGPIGKGGMGEVYRARDAKLQRDVAIKVLPPLFARDPERLARFEREARTLAALNHPHVAQVYGVIDVPADAGSHALVMEFVDGADLSERIARGGAVPLDEALPIARQVAEALEAAHEQGIIHRDLKPANIKVRADGQVKVLDFGLAKALAPVDPARDVNLENSPTITSPFQMSQLGVILGTAAYMAPEQARGKPLDKRVDIWAFGCVLYEMLTARRAFDGDDVTDTLAAIVRADPDWNALPGETPPAIRTLLRRCLEKDRRERLPDIGVARLELKDAPARAAPITKTAAPAPVRRAILPWASFALASLAAIAFLAYILTARPVRDATVVKSVILPPSPLSGAPALRMQISPDGRRIAFVAPDEAGRTLLWIRPLDSFTAQPLTGTANASSPFWSADSRWVAFIADGKLKKVDPSVGAVVTICDAGTAPPGTWNADDVILFTSAKSTIGRVSASGGPVAEATRLREGERVHIGPYFLPDGRHFLYTSTVAGAARPGIFVGSLDSTDVTPLLSVSSNSMYANGHLLFMRDTTLMAQRFDAASRALRGAAVPVAEGLQMNPSTGTGAFSVSQTGVLLYQTGVSAGTQLAWFDRAGKLQGLLGDPRGYRDVQLSPDERWVSVSVSSGGGQADVWVFDVARNLSRRLTFGEGGAASAVWTPDSQYLIYGARRGGNFDIYRKAASGGGTEELLFHDDNDKLPLGVTPDGGTVLYRVPRAAAAGELWLVDLAGGRKARPFAPGNTAQVPAQISADGKWLAYVSDESTRREVYVTSFPGQNGKWQVSPDGGDNPRWRRDSRELYFTSADRIMALEVNASDGQFQGAAVRELFSARVPAAALATRSTYAVTRDGQRFLVNTWDPRAALVPITVVVNWPESIR